MRRHIGFFKYLAQWRFAEAIAQLQPGSWPSTGWEQWACYRLVLYSTVANSRWDGKHLRGGMSVAVSLAACGELEAAAGMVDKLLARHGKGSYLVTLADALAPYMPELALTLLTPAHTPLPLRVALLLRNQEREKATTLLRGALASGEARRKPELLLLATNAEGGEPTVQLERMNAFLAAFALSPLSLLDTTHPPGTTNLAAATALPAVHGPLVSVLMTAYNTADRIGAAIASLLAQTYRDLEIVVVDDASSDDTEAVVRDLADKDARVKYLRLACNVGTYVAKTVGLDHARGEFVTCHDSDDWSHPLRIERQMRPLQDHPRLVATTSQWVRIQDDGVYYARSVYPLMRLNPASPLFRRQKVVEQAGLWDAVRTGADSEFHTRLKLVFGRQRVRRLAQPLAFGAHRPDSLMTASDTGYCAAGMSPKRLAYWEAWTHWHIAELHAGNKPVMPPIGSGTRPFAVPDAVAVQPESLAQCLAAAGMR